MASLKTTEKLDGPAIRAARVAQNPIVTQEDLAKELGIAVPTLISVEREDFALSADTLEAWLEAVRRIVTRRQQEQSS